LEKRCKEGWVCQNGICKEYPVGTAGLGDKVECGLKKRCRKGWVCQNGICKKFPEGTARLGESCNKEKLCAKDLKCVRETCVNPKKPKMRQHKKRKVR
jgi:hypothetical protein